MIFKHLTSLQLFIFAAFFCTIINNGNAQYLEPQLEQGVAITEPSVLRGLEQNGLSITNMLRTEKSEKPIESNLELSRTKSFQAVIQTIGNELQLYQKENQGSGVGMKYGKRLFDVSYLYNPSSRFVLVGVINRMDRAYKSPESCGETRLIYRLAYNVTQHNENISSRLPMTVNLVFKAKRPNSEISCQQLAQSWLNIQISENKKFVVQQILSNSGPLSKTHFGVENFEQLELNLQLVRWPAGVRPDFGGHAEYLLKVFKREGDTLAEATLENQIDRKRLLVEPNLLAQLKSWLTLPENIKAVDKGTLLIPEVYLDKKGISEAPGGINRSKNRLFYKLFNTEDNKTIKFEELELIKSQGGFLRRLNESTCVGCHQTRAIGGFHFMGRDPQGRYPGNSVYAPASGHFFGDLTRRRAIVEAFASGSAVDYTRGFSARPLERYAKDLNGAGVYNGWGAHCALPGGDPTFQSWGCAAGLKCTTLMDKKDAFGLGICLSASEKQIGDPCEAGSITTSDWGHDKYARNSIVSFATSDQVCSPQSAEPGASTGGFLNGSIRTRTCDGLSPEAVCGPLPAARSGFNACLTQKTFTSCVREFATGVGLRGCDFKNPCRDDYICSESFDSKRGACVPPYFLFQFRVDGHPL
jgi:hypothetical protein